MLRWARSPRHMAVTERRGQHPGSDQHRLGGAGLPFVNYCGAGVRGCSTAQDGLYFQNEARNFDHPRAATGRTSPARSPAGSERGRTQTRRANIVGEQRHPRSPAGSMANRAVQRRTRDGTPQVKLLPRFERQLRHRAVSQPPKLPMPVHPGHMCEHNDAKELRAPRRPRL